MSFLRPLLILAVVASTALAQSLPIPPYVQPGDGPTLDGSDVKVITWFGEGAQEPYVLEVLKDKKWLPGPAAEVMPIRPSATQEYLRYRVTLTDLPFNSEVNYRVRLLGKIVGGGKVATRKTADQLVRFVVIGDMADGKAPSKKIAWQISQAAPDFIVGAGDIVYSKGLVSEFMSKFWPVYHCTPPGSAETGAPILRSIPMYAVLGNHDVGGADLAMQPDGLGAFYFFSSPLNGPTNIPSFTKVKGTDDQVAAFKKAAGTTYPGLCNYSFDNGPVHILALDANSYVDFTSPTLRSWISNDLTSSKATWKIVVVHQPPFSSSEKHYTEQRVRLLSPLFEQCGVDMVFGGHVHNYQRSKPLTFQPDADKTGPTGTVEGKFTLDEAFDGVTNTVPKGIIYVVTGGGGASLYDPGFTDKPEKWRRLDRSWAPYTKKFVSDRHSFTLLEAHGDALAMRQFDYVGEEIERLQITKPAK